MRAILLSLVIAACFLVISSTYAFSPVEPLPLDEKVRLASHVFVAKIIEANEIADSGGVIYKVKLENLILPRNGWYPHNLILIHASEYRVPVGVVTGESFIFIVSPANGSEIFTSPCPREAYAPVKQMTEVIRAVYKKLKNEN